MAWGRGRQLKVELTGDSSHLERTLRKAEYQLQRFGKNTSTVAGAGGLGKTSAFGGLASRGNLMAAGGAAAALGLRTAINAQREAEVVLGQTSVAVENAGISWQRNAGRIDEAANRISKASAFDDEAVLQSFQVFVRGQKDVGKSLELAALAADVARGRYTSLESATQLVNKAAMGQVGALRRAGIQIDKNASATEALDALQRAYGGSAEKYANSAAGAQDRLNVALENLAESAGSLVAPAIEEMANNLTIAAEAANGLGSALSSLGAVELPIIGKVDELARKMFNVWKWTNPATAPFALGNAIFGGDDSGPAPIGDTAAGPGAGIGTAIATKAAAQRKKTAMAEAAKTLRGVLDAAMDVVADAQNDVAAALRRDASRNKLRAAAKAAADASKKFADQLRDNADAFKSAALRALDARQSNLDTSRGLIDAKKALAQARVLGGPGAIAMARRGLEDAQIARQRYLLENSKVAASKSSGYTIVMNGVTITGVQNVRELLAELRKMSKQNAGPTSGRSPAYHALR